jgi:hypothetical protein
MDSVIWMQDGTWCHSTTDWGKRKTSDGTERENSKMERDVEIVKEIENEKYSICCKPVCLLVNAQSSSAMNGLVSRWSIVLFVVTPVWKHDLDYTEPSGKGVVFSVIQYDTEQILEIDFHRVWCRRRFDTIRCFKFLKRLVDGHTLWDNLFWSSTACLEV